MSGLALYLALSHGLFFGALLLAASVGRAPERWGAGLLFTAAMLTWTVQGTFGNVVLAKLCIDAGYCLTLLLLLARYKRLWIGCAAAAQSVLLAFSSTRLTHFPLTEFEYVLMLNLSSLGVTGSLLAGTIASRWGKPIDADAELWGY